MNGNINDIHYLYLWNFQRKILINKIISSVANKYTKHIREDKIFEYMKINLLEIRKSTLLMQIDYKR